MVQGSGEFPHDMLRYDHCWPESESQTPLLSSDPRLYPESHYRERRQILIERFIESAKERPASGRWRSFGWEVLEDTVETIKR
jgi:hypothetical protein